MSQNRSIVDRVSTAFLKKIHESEETAGIAAAVSELISSNEKPKASDFVEIYQAQVPKKDQETAQ
jgi:hypothetical protein